MERPPSLCQDQPSARLRSPPLERRRSPSPPAAVHSPRDWSPSSAERGVQFAEEDELHTYEQDEPVASGAPDKKDAKAESGATEGPCGPMKRKRRRPFWRQRPGWNPNKGGGKPAASKGKSKGKKGLKGGKKGGKFKPKGPGKGKAWW